VTNHDITHKTAATLKTSKNPNININKNNPVDERRNVVKKYFKKLEPDTLSIDIYKSKKTIINCIYVINISYVSRKPYLNQQ